MENDRANQEDSHSLVRRQGPSVSVPRPKPWQQRENSARRPSQSQHVRCRPWGTANVFSQAPKTQPRRIGSRGSIFSPLSTAVARSSVPPHWTSAHLTNCGREQTSEPTARNPPVSRMAEAASRSLAAADQSLVSAESGPSGSTKRTSGSPIRRAYLGHAGELENGDATDRRLAERPWPLCGRHAELHSRGGRHLPSNCGGSLEQHPGRRTPSALAYAYERFGGPGTILPRTMCRKLGGLYAEYVQPSSSSQAS